LTLVVLDTGALVAGLYWLNEPHQCLQAWQNGLCQFVVSNPIFEEYQRVARRVRDDQRLTGDPGPFLN